MGEEGSAIDVGKSKVEVMKVGALVLFVVLGWVAVRRSAVMVG